MVADRDHHTLVVALGGNALLRKDEKGTIAEQDAHADEVMRHLVPLVAAAYVVLGLEHHFATGMHYARKTVWAAGIGVFALAVMILFNLVFLPRVGILAAAAATLVGVSVRSFLFLVVSQRLYAIPFELRRLGTAER